MALTTARLITATDSVSSSGTTANMRSGRDVVEYHLYNPTAAELDSLESFVLGKTAVANGSQTDGRLKRTSPLVHPIHSSRFASNIVEVKGVGGALTATATQLDWPMTAFPTTTTILYPEYTVKVEFTPRLYTVLRDGGVKLFLNTVDADKGSWYDLTGTKQYFSYCNEWLRFTDYEVLPKDDWVTATGGGMMKFVAGAGAADGKPYAAQARIRLPNQMLKMTWYGVPYRYVTSPNSYVTKYLGYVNQNDWYHWKAGQLLYINYNPVRYPPPQPEQDFAAGAPAGAFAQLCDLELYFVLTTRTTTDTVPAPANLNNVAKGHNLFPWYFDRKFHYAAAADGSAFWPSFPVEILFFDPDVPHTGGL